MKYFRVINPDDKQYINPKTGWHLVNNELYTEKQIKKLCLPKKINYFDWAEAKTKEIEINACFERIETSSRNTYYFFGARFVLDKIKVNRK